MSLVQSAPKDQIKAPSAYADARLAFRDCGNAELYSHIEALSYAVDDPFDETDGWLSHERLRACQDELARRHRLHALNTSLPDPRAARYEQIDALRKEVRERVDIVEVLAAYGHLLVPANRAETEWCGPCPACGGADRFRAWPGPPGRFWCRQCHWSGDVITLTRSLAGGTTGFAEAVARLAKAAGVRDDD